MRGWMWAGAAALTIGAAAAGCAEGGTGNATGSYGGGATTTGTGAGGGASSSTGGGTSSTTSSTSGGPPGHAVINEISAKGGDWIEIANPSSAAVDLSGYGLCDDVDPTMGSMCDVSTMVVFPQGTTLPAGGYLLVVGNQAADAGVGPHVMCLSQGGPTTCFYATWKVSASNGETVHLVDPNVAPVDEAHYPMDAVPSGQTWGRLPDGTGSFAANQPTPGAANQAP